MAETHESLILRSKIAAEIAGHADHAEREAANADYTQEIQEKWRIAARAYRHAEAIAWCAGENKHE